MGTESVTAAAAGPEAEDREDGPARLDRTPSRLAMALFAPGPGPVTAGETVPPGQIALSRLLYTESSRKSSRSHHSGFTGRASRRSVLVSG
jgi:hypothetical protein